MSIKVIVISVIMFCLFCPWFTPFWIVIGVIAAFTFGGLVHEEETNPPVTTIEYTCDTCGWPEDGICTICTGANYGHPIEVSGKEGCDNWKERINK